MIIKKYSQFIRESNDFNLGLWLIDKNEEGKSLSDDEYIMNIVNRYINDGQKLYGGKDINIDIDLENAVNLLEDRTKKEIKQQIDKYLENGIEEKEPIVLTSTVLESQTEIQNQAQIESNFKTAGGAIFNTFLTTLTHLGLKENSPNWELCPEDFLLFYFFPNLDSELVKQIFSRYRSLTRYLHLIDYSQNQLNLYFGLTKTGQCEYGIYYDSDSKYLIGVFDIPKNVSKWVSSLESKSASSLKKEIVNMSYSDIMTLGKIKDDMKSFSPGYFEKRLTPMLRDRIATFGFYGVGKWDNGKLDEGEYLNIKNNFTTWLLSKKWGNKVLISVKPESFWLYIHIKLK